MHLLYFARNQLLNHISLKIVDDYVFYIVFSIAILLSYLFIKPFIMWFVTLESVHLLSYLMSSLMIIILFLFMMIYIDNIQDLFLGMFKITLECLAVFGILLLLYRGYQRISRKA